MQWIWLAIIVVSGIPVAVAAALINPFAILLIGMDRWRDITARVYPYRWHIAFSGAVLAFSLGIYTARYR